MLASAKTAARVAGWLLVWVLVLFSAIWGALALSVSGPVNDGVRLGLAAAFGLLSLSALVFLFMRHWRRRALAAYGVLFAALLLWWGSLAPANERDWQADVAVLPFAEIDGDMVTMRNIRNFNYRSEFDYTPAYYDKRFDLKKLQGVDVVSVYWMGPAIAHVFLSFAFEGGEQIAISIETRKQKGEAYSTLKGFFRQYELYYVVADERDVIGLRTNYRRDPPEDVYIYRTKSTPEAARRLFLDYVREINALKTSPDWYNTLTTNCTTNIWMHSRVNNKVPLSWKILASGYVPEYLYEIGGLETGGLAFAQLQQRAHANARANAAGITADFSKRIRETPAR